jgi:hypothetical protein
MNRLILVAAVSAAICNCFAVSAFAGGNDNDPHMQMYSYDGTLSWDEGKFHPNFRPRKMAVQEQNKKKRMDGTGPGGPVKYGPDDRQKPDKSRDRY